MRAGYATPQQALEAFAEAGARAFLLLAMVVIWAVRLGSYLFLRIRKAGADPSVSLLLIDLVLGDTDR